MILKRKLGRVQVTRFDDGTARVLCASESRRGRVKAASWKRVAEHGCSSWRI